MISNKLKELLPYPHPTWQSKQSENRANHFLQKEYKRSPSGLRVNLGSGSCRYSVSTLNLDIDAGKGVDVQASALDLPLRDQTVDSIVCTGVLEHVVQPQNAVNEILRVMKAGGRIYIEVPFMQTFHASPGDYYRWTSEGLKQLLASFEIAELNVVAGPASALAWQFQETMAAIFSFRKKFLYESGLRIFGYMAIPISWLDFLLESHPYNINAACGFSVLAQKS